MGTVWGVLLVLGFGTPLLLVLGGTVLAVRYARRTLPAPPSVHASAAPQSARSRRSWGLAGLFLATGALLPWATGLGVKLYLDSLGRPTLPVSDFLNPAAVPVLLFQTLALWAFPYLILASAVVVPWRVGIGVGTSHRKATFPIWLAYLGGSVVAIPLFGAVFWEFDMMMLFVPLGTFLLPVMTLGYLAGWWLVRQG